MTDKDASNEVVVFFDTNGDIAHEVLFADFEDSLEQALKVEAFAASVVNAAYVAVASGLHVTGIVFFTITVDENGVLDPGFNVPLAYLLENAGTGPDLGAGPIGMSCRSQCSVPWHARTLWEPSGSGEAHPAHVIQRSIWRNRLGMKLMGDKPFVSGNGDGVAEDEPALIVQPALMTEARDEQVEATFGEQGTVSLQQLIKHYNEQIGSLREKHRRELEDRQQASLSQVRSYRDEIHRLKVELRHEQNRNVRLQQILRGEVDGH